MKKLTLLYYPRISDPIKSGIDYKGDYETMINWEDLVRHETYYSDKMPSEEIVEFVERLQASNVVYVSQWEITEE